MSHGVYWIYGVYIWSYVFQIVFAHIHNACNTKKEAMNFFAQVLLWAFYMALDVYCMHECNYDMQVYQEVQF